MIGKEVIRFSVYLVHALAEAWKIAPSRVYCILNDSSVLDKYIIPCFDTLHCLGREALVDDMTEFVREKGYSV